MKGKTNDSNDMNREVGKDKIYGKDKSEIQWQSKGRIDIIGLFIIFILQNPQNIDKMSHTSCWRTRENMNWHLMTMYVKTI